MSLLTALWGLIQDTYGGVALVLVFDFASLAIAWWVAQEVVRSRLEERSARFGPAERDQRALVREKTWLGLSTWNEVCMSAGPITGLGFSMVLGILAMLSLAEVFFVQNDSSALAATIGNSYRHMAKTYLVFVLAFPSLLLGIVTPGMAKWLLRRADLARGGSVQEIQLASAVKSARLQEEHIVPLLEELASRGRVAAVSKLGRLSPTHQDGARPTIVDEGGRS